MKIPAGVNNGSTLRVRGEGDVGPRGYALFIDHKLWIGDSVLWIKYTWLFLKCTDIHF